MSVLFGTSRTPAKTSLDPVGVVEQIDPFAFQSPLAVFHLRYWNQLFATYGAIFALMLSFASGSMMIFVSDCSRKWEVYEMSLPDWLYVILPASIANKNLADQETHPKYERIVKAIEAGDIEASCRALKKLMTAKYIGPKLKLQIQLQLPELLADLGKFEEAEEVALSTPAIDAGLMLENSVVGCLLAQIDAVKGDSAAAADHFEHAAKRASCFETPELAYNAGYQYAAYLLKIGTEADRAQKAVSALIDTLEGSAQFAYHEPCLRHLEVAAAFQAERYDEVLQLEPRIFELAEADKESGGQWSEPIEKAKMIVVHSKLRLDVGNVQMSAEDEEDLQAADSRE